MSFIERMAYINICIALMTLLIAALQLIYTVGPLHPVTQTPETDLWCRSIVEYTPHEIEISISISCKSPL